MFPKKNSWSALATMYVNQSLLLRWVHPVFLATIFMLLCTSCAELQPQKLPVPTASTQHTNARAERLFIQGDFENALLEYEQIYETALSWEDKNHALYGLACTQMMLARNSEQLIEAIDNLQMWDTNKGTRPFTENRHLLVLALKQQGSLIEDKNTALKEHERQQKTIIANQELKITQLTSANDTLQIEIEKLRKQIEEIEAIDENVQSKRKPL